MHSVSTINKILLVFLLLLIAAASVSCTITGKRYKVLKVFFDGVPDPDARVEAPSPQEEQSPDQQEKRPARKLIKIESKHPDFYDRNCDKCHNKSATNFLKAPKEKFCFICHDKDDFTGEFLHGPVAVSDCLACHLPHQSQHKYLLKETDARMCLECHMKEDVALNPVHKDVDFEQVNCTQCHNPHSAPKRFFLKI